jgi:hypothetical protein
MCSLSLRSSHQHPVCTSPVSHTRHMSRPSHFSWFDQPNNFGEQYRSQSSSLCSFLHPPATSSFLGLNMFLSTLLSNNLSLCSSLHRAWGKLRKLRNKLNHDKRSSI